MARREYAFDGSYLNVLTTGSTSIFTVPADTKVNIKEIHLLNASGSVRTISILVTRSGTDYYYEAALAIPSGGVYDKEPNLVLQAGDIFKINTDGQVYSTISGLSEDSST